MHAVELFAGAGGASLGLHRAGFRDAVMVEAEPHAAQTLRAATRAGWLDGVVIQRDVRDVDFTRYAGTPLVWASWPCQPFSSAGKRQGARDARNGWPWTLRAVDEIGPSFFLGENVTGLIAHRKACDRHAPQDCPGCYSEQVIEADLKARFAWTARWVLDAADFGVPSHRRRVFYCASNQGPLKRPAPTHAPQEQADDAGLHPHVGMGQALEHDPWGRLEAIYGGTVLESALVDLPKEDRQMYEQWGHDDFYCHLCAAPISSGWCVCPLPHEAEEILSLPAPTIAGGSTRGHVGGGSVLSATMSTRQERHWALSRYHRTRPQKRQTRASVGLDPLEQQTTYVGVTVREVKLLMGFPVDYPLTGADQWQYRQLGNAVAPPVAEALGRAVMKAARRRRR